MEKELRALKKQTHQDEKLIDFFGLKDADSWLGEYDSDDIGKWDDPENYDE